MSDPRVKKYKIHCLACDHDLGEVIIFNDDRISYDPDAQVISARKRSDNNWGFQCGICGNYSIVAPGEVEDTIRRSRLDDKTRIMLRTVVATRQPMVKVSGKMAEIDGFRMTEIDE